MTTIQGRLRVKLWLLVAATLCRMSLAAPQADQPPVALPATPEFYGFYAIDGGRLIELGDKLRTPDQSSLSVAAQFVLFTRAPSPESALLGPRELRLTSIVRFTIKGNFLVPPVGPFAMNERELLAELNYEETNAATSRYRGDPVIPYREKPVSGQPQMVQIVPRKPLTPGYYVFSDSPNHSYVFCVKWADAKPHYVDRWDLTGNGMFAEYKESSLLDDALRQHGLAIVNGRAVPGSTAAAPVPGSTSAPNPTGSAALRAKIAEQWMANLRVPAPILEWREGVILKASGSDNSYWQLYWAAVNRSTLSQDALTAATLLLEDSSRLPDANKFYETALRYAVDSTTLFSAAARILQGSTEATATVLDAVYTGSKYSVKFGLYSTCGKTCYEAADLVFMASDFAVTYSIKGLDAASQEAMTTILAKVILADANVSRWMQDHAAQVVARPEIRGIIETAVKSPGLQAVMRDELTKATLFATGELAERAVKEITAPLVTLLQKHALVSRDDAPQAGETTSRQPHSTQTFEDFMSQGQSEMLKLNWQAARRAFEKAVALSPGNTAAEARLREAREDEQLILEGTKLPRLVGRDFERVSSEATKSYTAKDYPVAIRKFKYLVNQRRNYLAAYNVACCYALLGEVHRACTWLEIAFALGFSDRKQAQADADLVSIRNEPRFRALMASK